MATFKSRKSYDFDDISLNTIENMDEGRFTYSYMLHCHGKEESLNKNVYLNEHHYFNNIAFGNSYGRRGFTDARVNQVIDVPEYLMDKLGEVNTNFLEERNNLPNNQGYHVNDLGREFLGAGGDEDNEDLIALNPMSFEIQKSDYEGYNKDPGSDAYNHSENYMREFGLFLYKRYTFKCKLKSYPDDVTFDIGLSFQKVRLIHNVPELHNYFSNPNRNLNDLSLENGQLLNSDIRTYMEPDHVCSWNTILNMCYEHMHELGNFFQESGNPLFRVDLRILCCRHTSDDVQPAIVGKFKYNTKFCNYIPIPITNDYEYIQGVGAHLNICTIDDDSYKAIFDCSGTVMAYLRKTYDQLTGRDYYKNNQPIHFTSSNHRLLLAFTLLGFQHEMHNNISLLFNRLYSITLDNRRYSLYYILCTLTANIDENSKYYSRKKISLLGNTHNNQQYMLSLFNQLEGIPENNYTDVMRDIYNYLNYKIQNPTVTGYSRNEIVDEIIMLTKTLDYMDNYDVSLNLPNQNPNPMDVEGQEGQDNLLTFNFNENKNFNTMLNECGFLNDLTDDFYDSISINLYNGYTQQCIYFTTFKDFEMNESNEPVFIEEAAGVFILSLVNKESFSSHMIYLDNDRFENREKFDGDAKSIIYPFVSEDQVMSKNIIRELLFHGFLKPLYRKGFNYIDFIYRRNNIMLAGQPPHTFQGLKRKRQQNQYKELTKNDLDKNNDPDNTKEESEEREKPKFIIQEISNLYEKPEKKLSEDEIAVINISKTRRDLDEEEDNEEYNFRPFNKKPLLDNLDPPSGSSFDFYQTSTLPAPLFPLNPKRSVPAVTPNQPISKREPGSGSSYVLARGDLTGLSKSDPIISAKLDFGPENPPLAVSKSMTQIPRIPSTASYDQLPIEDKKELQATSRGVSAEIPMNRRVASPGAIFNLGLTQVDIENDNEMDVQKETGGKKRNSKKRKVKKNGKTKKKRVKKRNAKKNK